MAAHAVLSTTRILETVSSPRDLQRLSRDDVGQLASEIRAELIGAVAERGGHLGANLGAVELTLALHRCFESPTDTIVWDTGHQVYVHKMLTGRRAAFVDLRRENGLSGYSSRAESEHDVVENSHASVALGYAYGLARARRDNHGRGAVVAVVGDGALTGGVAYEALNNIGWSRVPVVIVLNDNGRSYAPTVSRLCGADGAARPFFAALGLDYIGPIDGHDLGALEDTFSAVATTNVPLVVHVLTRKGCGYEHAEADMVKCMHDVAPFDVATGAPRVPRRASYTDAFAEAIVDIAASRRDVYAITAAMGDSTGLSPFERLYPDRYIDVGIAEQHAVTCAAGLALAGCRPIVALFSTFLNRAWDQVYYDVGLHRLPVVFCIDRAGITGDDGPSHHGLLDLALLTKVPGITVLAPSSYEEVGLMLRHAMTLDGPVALRWPKGAAPRVSPAEVGRDSRARCVRRGRDVCVIAVGRLVAEAVSAADLLAERGVEASVWDARCVTPLDEAMLRSAAAHRAVVTVEDGIAEGGVGALVARAVEASRREAPRVRVLGAPTRYIPHADPQSLLARLGLDAAGIAESTLQWLRPITR